MSQKLFNFSWFLKLKLIVKWSLFQATVSSKNSTPKYRGGKKNLALTSFWTSALLPDVLLAYFLSSWSIFYLHITYTYIHISMYMHLHIPTQLWTDTKPHLDIKMMSIQDHQNDGISPCYRVKQGKCILIPSSVFCWYWWTFGLLQPPFLFQYSPEELPWKPLPGMSNR